MKTIIRSACVVTMDDRLDVLHDADVLIDGPLIAAVGRGLCADGAEVIDGTDRIVMPGLIDTHRHCYHSMLRGCGANDSYDVFWKRVSQGYGAAFLPEDTYLSIRFGLAEAIESGITTVHAWEQNMESPAHADAAVRALVQSGMRGRFSYGPASNPASPHSILNPLETIDLEDAARLRDAVFTLRRDGRRFHPDGLLDIGIACRHVRLTKPEIWRREFAFARDQELALTLHVTGGAITVLREYQALGPDVLAVHAHHASDDEIRYLAASGTPVSCSIGSLLRSGTGRSPMVAMMRAGVRLCLSMDSTAISDSGDMFAQMRMGVLVERGLYEDQTVYSPADALRQATIDGAIAMGLGHVTGSITPGKRADLIVVRTTDLNMGPFIDPKTHIVFSAQPRNVETVFIDGVCKKRDGVLVGVDVPDLVRSVRRAVTALGERYGEPVH